MSELDIIDLYERSSKKRTEEFSRNIESNLRVQTDINKAINDTSWIEIMEEVIPHIDAIFRNPNRFIINDEEIVKIESARKVTVESIKHLAKNTNLIQSIDQQTGDVQPGKILNVNKEEDYDTYENRLIYTLVQKMKMFIERRTKNLEEKLNAKGKDNKSLDYEAKSKLMGEKIDITFSLNSKLDDDKNDSEKQKEELLFKIEEIKKKINELTGSAVYKIIDKKNISWIKEPIRKTNVVLKNVHFQYAMKLWEYLKEHFDEKAGEINEQQDYMDEGTLRHLADETFLLQYLLMRTLEQDEMENEETNMEIKNIMMEQLIDKMLDIDTNMTGQEIKQLVAARYEVIKYKKLEVLQEIQKIFKKNIDNYIQKVEKKGG